MIKYSRGRRVRQWLFTLVVLCCMTATLIVVEIFIYTEYRQLSALARTAFDEDRKVEATAIRLGIPIDDGYLFPCRISNSSDRQRPAWHGLLLVPDDGQLLASCISKSVYVHTAGLCNDPAPRADGTETISVGCDHPALDRIDVLTGSGDRVSFDVVWVDGMGFHLRVRAEADRATGAAQAALESLLAGVVALLLANVLGVRRLTASTHAPRLHGTTGKAAWQQPRGQAWTDRAAVGLIASAVRALDHPDDQERYHEEWAADAEEVPAGWRRLRWAMLLRLCAPGGIREARHCALTKSPAKQQSPPKQP